MIRIGERTSGADGQDGSEALQKSLLKVLTDLAEASTEVMCQWSLVGRVSMRNSVGFLWLFLSFGGKAFVSRVFRDVFCGYFADKSKAVANPQSYLYLYLEKNMDRIIGHEEEGHIGVICTSKYPHDPIVKPSIIIGDGCLER